MPRGAMPPCHKRGYAFAAQFATAWRGGVAAVQILFTPSTEQSPRQSQSKWAPQCGALASFQRHVGKLTDRILRISRVPKLWRRSR
jgi:hypothetical protein